MNFNILDFSGNNSLFYGLLIILAAFLVYLWRRIGAKSENKIWDAFSNQNGAATPTLNHFSRDLTVAARENKMDPLIGRGEELKRIIQILSRRTKNNAILVGEAGAGKTALAEGLAQEIASERVPPVLRQKRVLALNLGGMLAGTQYRGEFEQRMKIITDEISAAGRNIILFIDEIQNLTQAGESSGAIGAANLLKPALARGDIQAVGACTFEDYFQYISRDASLERRFQPVLVEEPTPDETFRILQGIKTKYEKHHQITISDEILQFIIDSCGHYLLDRFFPDKAIDVMDEAAAKLRLENISVVGQPPAEWPALQRKDVEDVILLWSRDLSQLRKKSEMLEKK